MRRVVLLGAIITAGCTEPVVAPPPVSPVPIRATNGISGVPVAADGPAAALAGAEVRLTALGYLPRETTVPADGRITFWPVTVSEDFVRAVVYTGQTGPRRLIRWDRTTASIGPLAPDRAIADFNALGLGVQLVRAPAGERPDIDVAVDPNDPVFIEGARGLTTGSLSPAGAIVSARIVVTDASLLDSPVMLHEIGHALGLFHSSRTTDIMYETPVASTFSVDERVLLAMMYRHRRPGTTFPDNDTHLGAASAAPRRFTIVD